ncbi:MAG: flagellar hook-basal body complex protein [Lachnospiraceae bacterium]|nr:flagellar hook-basal body complex protein [Lachnospiraceae bacterium]
MMRSLFSGVSGLKTHQQRMDVIGNNIANVNTTAFKSSSTTFQDIMYQTMSDASGGTATRGGVNPRQIGLGVTTAATKVSVTTSGSAETTNDGFDLRLSDTNSTNFFIVNNGTQNLFTRSGSFYVDGNGYLSMTSTGYHVMGWQANKETGTISKDTVSALRLMDPANQTSEPEYTSQAHLTGIIDENDSNVESTDGLPISLTFYDDLGYSYTAKFAVKKGEDKATDGTVMGTNSTSAKDANGYTIELTSITSDSNVDSEGNPIDLLKNYIDNQEAKYTTNGTLNIPANTFGNTQAINNTAEAEKYIKASLFGSANGYNVDSFKLDASSDFRYDAASQSIVKGNGANQVSITVKELKEQMDKNGLNGTVQLKAGTGSTATAQTYQISRIFSGLQSAMSNYYTENKDGTSTVIPGKNPTFTFDATSQTLKVKTDAANYDVFFKSSDGTFDSISGRQGTTSTTTQQDTKTRSFGTGSNAVTFNVNLLGSQFNTDGISIDFTNLLNYNHGGSSTASIDRGTITDSSSGAGRQLGTLNGLSVQTDGKIYGSYTNGNTVLLGQISTTQFANASGLESLGDNCYGETLNSGSFDGIGQEITSDGSSMNAGQLEMSNVDLAQEFTEMITTQRGFQANSRIITVSDTLLEELTNLKR